MIYTCTLNPSLDYYLEFEKPLQLGKYNRSQLEYYEAGGKGINVSIVLNNLMIPTRALGFLGGFTKEFYIALLQKYEYVQPNFTYIEGHTRINVKLHGTEDTDLNAAGPYITDNEMKSLMDKVGRMDSTDYFVFAGYCQEYLFDDAEEMLKKAMQNGVKVVLDTNPKLVKQLLQYKPFVLKTTVEEMETLFNTELKEQADVIAKMKELHEMGAVNVMVVKEKKEALLVCDKGTYSCDILYHEKAVNTVGTGDSMVAGFLMNYLRTADAADSFRFGSCCGSATAYSKGLATREKIDSFYEKSILNRID